MRTGASNFQRPGFFSSASRTAIHTVGTPQAMLTRSLTIRPRTLSGSTLGPGRTRRAPSMEHGSDRQHRVEMAHAKNFAEAARKGVQHQRAVRIDDTFGMTGRARGEAHGCAVVFVELRITKVVASIGEKEFVI